MDCCNLSTTIFPPKSPERLLLYMVAIAINILYIIAKK
jgi:hypothetical protein